MRGLAQTSSSSRRADIDYLRVIALLLLIVYHVLLVFDAGDWWRVKSENVGYWADYFIAVLTPWRMSLVFCIGGIAARFILEKSTPAGFVRDRAAKLLVAFAFAVIVLVPLQRYVRLDELHEAHGGFLDYFAFHAAFVVPYHGIWLPDFANAWFLPYLFAYSVAGAALWKFAPQVFSYAQKRVEAAPLLLVVLATMAWFSFVESLVAPGHPVTGIIFTDIAAHLKFAPLFLLGLLIGKSNPFREKTVSARFYLWPAAAALLAVSLSFQWMTSGAHPDQNKATLALLALRGLYGGAMLFAVLAFAEWALNRPSRFIRYATDAILPVYLMHQTVLVVVADAIVPRHWPLWAELAILFASTSLIPLAIYHVLVRHNGWLRVLFGLRPKLNKPVEPEISGKLAGA